MPSLTTLVDGTIPVAADFNGNYQALNNAIGSNTAISAWAIGEIPYASGTNTLSRLSPGTIGQVLQMGTTVPAWGAQSVGGCFMSNSGGDPTNDIDVSVGARFSDDAAFASRTWISLASALTKQLDAAWAVGTNQGMRATGAAIANGTYHIFLIMRPDTGVVDIAADTSATGANIPANTNSAYTKKWRIGSILRESATIIPFVQDQTYFRRKATILDVSAVNPGTSAVTRTLSVPLGLNIFANINGSIASAGSGGVAYLSDLAVNDEAASATAAPLATVGAGAATQNAMWNGLIRTNTSGQIRSRLNASGADTTLLIATLGWVDLAAMGNG
jgi:hypothetical protein